MSFTLSSRALEGSVEAQLELTADSLAKQLDMWLTERKREVRNWSENKTFATTLEGGFVGKSALKSAENFMANLKKEYLYMEMVGLADKEGLVMASDNPEVKGTSVADDKFFQETINGKSFFSDARKSKTTGNRSLIISYPVKRGDQTDGVFFVVVDIKFINKTFVQPLKIGETGYVFLFRPQRPSRGPSQ